MKITRRKLVAAAAAAAIFLSLAACSSGGGGSKEIEIWYRPGSLPSDAVAGLQKHFPQAHLKIVKTPDVDTKLTAALRSNSGIPDVAVALLSQYQSATDKFANLNDYGFESVKGDYLGWKVKMGQDAKHRQIGVPIDIGPFGFFYRTDYMEKAGLPTDPAEVGKLVATARGYEQAAQKIKAATGSVICDSASGYYTNQRLQNGFYFSNSKRQFVPSNHVNEDAAISAIELGQKKLCLGAPQYTPDWSAGIAQNKLVGWIGPAYVAANMLTAGGDSAGKWRVTTAPGGAASQFGSFISVMKASKNPALATQIAEWLTNPENQAKGYAKDSLFPSTPSSLTMPEMTKPDPFFGGQVISEVLGKVAEKAPTLTIIAQSDKAATVYSQAIDQAAADGTDPKQAYDKAVKAAEDLK